MMELSFLCEKKILTRLKRKATFALICFVIKISCFPNYVSDQGNWLDLLLDLLLVMNENMSHYMHMKDFDRFMFHKTKNTFVRVVYSVLVVKMY